VLRFNTGSDCNLPAEQNMYSGDNGHCLGRVECEPTTISFRTGVWYKDRQRNTGGKRAHR
jgi:hypothetical protein